MSSSIFSLTKPLPRQLKTLKRVLPDVYGNLHTIISQNESRRKASLYCIYLPATPEARSQEALNDRAS